MYLESKYIRHSCPLFQEPYPLLFSTLGKENSECKKYEEACLICSRNSTMAIEMSGVNETDSSKKGGQTDGVSEGKHVPGRGVLHTFGDASHIKYV